RNPERDHQLREIRAPEDEKACDESEQSGRDRGRCEPDERIRDDPDRQQPRHVGTETEERCMPKRYDSGVAEDEVERESEQPDDRDFIQDEMSLRKNEETRDGDQPEENLLDSPPTLSAEYGSDMIGNLRLHRKFFHQ